MKPNLRSKQFSRLGGAGKQTTRKVVFREAVENLFESFLNQSNATQTPKRFYEIYNSPLMRSYLLATLSYFQAFLEVVDTARHLKSATTSSSKQAGETGLTEYKSSRLRQREAFNVFSEFYARVLLSCSLYDQTRSEEHFFQCLFRFTLLFLQENLRFAVAFRDKAAIWRLVEQELADMLKGPSILTQPQAPKHPR